MSPQSGTIRPRRRDVVAADEQAPTSRAQRSTRILIRIPLLSGDQTAQTGQRIASGGKTVKAATVGRLGMGSTAPTLTTSGNLPGSSSAEVPSTRELTAAESQAQQTQQALETNPQLRIDAAHARTIAPHAQKQSWIQHQAGWLVKVLQRKSLLAIGLILVASGVVAAMVLVVGQSHSNVHSTERFGDGSTAPPAANRTPGQSFMPAPPRATSENDLRLPNPSLTNSRMSGPLPTGPGLAPAANSNLPAAVLGTTRNSAVPIAPAATTSVRSAWSDGSSTGAAMNLPAAVLSPANAASRPTTDFSTPTPVMAEYRMPQPAVPDGGALVTNQKSSAPTNYPSPPGSANGPIFEARRETLPSVTPGGNSVGGNLTSGARFDGVIGKPFEPRAQ